MKQSKDSRLKQVILLALLSASLLLNLLQYRSSASRGACPSQNALEDEGPLGESRVGTWSEEQFQKLLERAEAVYQRHQLRRVNISGTEEELVFPFPESFNVAIRHHHPFLGQADWGLDAFRREYLMLPSYPCFEEERLGRWGEGGKWVCMSSLHKKPQDLVVYSVGSNGDPSFEESVFEILGAKSHTFDPFITSFQQQQVQSLPFVEFHQYGLAGDTKNKAMDRGIVGEVKDLGTIMAELGHSFIDLLKVDCEGCEVGFVDRLFTTTKRKKPIFGQLLMEIHNLKDLENESRMLSNLRKLGFRMFHQEINFFEPGKVFEVAFIHESLVTPRSFSSRLELLHPTPTKS